MRELAELARQALREPDTAAAKLCQLYGSKPALLETVMKFAELPLADIEDYEKKGTSYLLIKGRFGVFWLVPGPGFPKRVLMPPASIVNMRGLRALGLGLVNYFTRAEAA